MKTMRCPPEIATILSEILRMGLLRIRALDDLARCRLEADHLHNLPRLLVDYQAQLLEYYWNVERVCLQERSTPEDVRIYESLWQALAKHIDSTKNAVAAS